MVLVREQPWLLIGVLALLYFMVAVLFPSYQYQISGGTLLIRRKILGCVPFGSRRISITEIQAVRQADIADLASGMEIWGRPFSAGKTIILLRGMIRRIYITPPESLDLDTAVHSPHNETEALPPGVESREFPVASIVAVGLGCCILSIGSMASNALGREVLALETTAMWVLRRAGEAVSGFVAAKLAARLTVGSKRNHGTIIGFVYLGLSTLALLVNSNLGQLLVVLWTGLVVLPICRFAGR